MSTVNPEQTLDEFVAEMKREMDEFQANWKAQHAKDPEKWPMKMAAGDWYDQLLMTLS